MTFEQYLESLIGRYRSAGVLVDTNLLLLYFVGAYDSNQVARFKRTADRFAPEDFETLVALLERFDKVVVTPHILTEVSNLLGQLSGSVRRSCFEMFRQNIRHSMNEQYASGEILSEDPAFVKLGITDVSILEVASRSHLVATDDFALSGYLTSKNLDVLNFNNIRTLNY